MGAVAAANGGGGEGGAGGEGGESSAAAWREPRACLATPRPSAQGPSDSEQRECLATCLGRVRKASGGSPVRAWRRLGQVRKVQGQWQRR